MVRTRGEGTELLSRHDIRGAVRPTSIPDGLFHVPGMREPLLFQAREGQH